MKFVRTALLVAAGAGLMCGENAVGQDTSPAPASAPETAPTQASAPTQANPPAGVPMRLTLQQALVQVHLSPA